MYKYRQQTAKVWLLTDQVQASSSMSAWSSPITIVIDAINDLIPKDLASNT